MKKILDMRALFLVVFLLLNIYYLAVKPELYESRTSLMVRDLGSSSSSATIGLSILGAGDDSVLKDSMVVQEYLESLDMFLLLDNEHKLKVHYKSGNLDIIERLNADATIEKVLEFYNKRLMIVYDEMSGLLHISFSHTNPDKAQEILKFLVSQVEFSLNEFNRKKAKKHLKFIESEYENSKKNMADSSLILEQYQNKHLLLDPTAEATSSSSIISNLESMLTQKNIAYKTKSAYLNSNNYELKALKSEIKEITASLKNAKKGLAGDGDQNLNKVIFEYNKLKLQHEFDIEIYKNNLLQLETTKIDVIKSAKTLSIISKPNLPDGYTYPNKPKVFITILVVMLLIYGIFSMLLSIIRDHKE